MFTRELMEKIIIALMIGAVSWLFINSLKVDPVVTAVNQIKLVIVENSKTNAKLHKQNTAMHRADRENNALQHSELAMLIYEQNVLIAGGKERLKAVELRCDSNHATIKDCEDRHYKIFKPFPYIKDTQ